MVADSPTRNQPTNHSERRRLIERRSLFGWEPDDRLKELIKQTIPAPPGSPDGLTNLPRDR